jgi:NAD(P)-dependent dehydrogenase (short-subunit alcohol dehydrogenase family)
MMAGFPADKHALEDVIKENYMRRQGLPEEVAESLLWMVSGRASFVTATMLNVNGGKFRCTAGPWNSS